MFFKKSFGVLLVYIPIDIGNSQYYSYLVPLHLSFYRPPSKLTQHLVYNVAYSPYSNYNNYKHRTIVGNPYYTRRHYRYRASNKFPITSSNSQATENHTKRTDVPAKPLPSPNGTTTNAITADSPSEKLVERAEKGFRLLDNLVETVSQAAGTTKDSDIAEINAVKSIFSDVIDLIIRLIQKEFKDIPTHTQIGDVFVNISSITKMIVNQASNQRSIAEVVKPYIIALKEFTAKGFQMAS